MLSMFQGKYAEAMSYYKRAADKWEELFGPKHETVARTAVGMGEVSRELVSASHCFKQHQHVNDALVALTV